MKTYTLSDLIQPGSLTIHDPAESTLGYSRKAFIVGKHDKEDGKFEWSPLYGDLTDLARSMANTVDGTVGTLKLVRQKAGEHEGKLVAIVEPRCMIGHTKLGIVDSLGDLEGKLPHPFHTLDDLSRPV